jgi:hypothetical protein
MLALMVSTASGSRLSFSEQAFQSELGPLTFRAGGLSISCSITIEGSLHSRTISKTSGALVGYVFGGIERGEACSGGTARGLEETLPWHIRYSSFTGTLPRITGIRLQVIGVAISMEPSGSGLLCLYKSTTAAPAFVTAVVNAEGTITSLRADETSGIPLESGFLCPSEGKISGTGLLTIRESNTSITVRLVA